MLMKKVEKQGWHHTQELPELPATAPAGIDVPVSAITLPSGRG